MATVEVEMASGLRSSPDVGELQAALAEAQGSWENPPRNREVSVRMKSGGEYKFAYTTFDEMVNVIRPHFRAHGLSFLQGPRLDGSGNLLLTTRLGHKSGQWIECDVPVLQVDPGPQALGSALTYAKRYGLCSITGLASDDDDDGNAACGNAAVARDRVAVPRQSAPPPPARSPERPPQSQHAAPVGPPKTGREFFKYLCDHGKTHKLDLVGYINEWASLQGGFPDRIVDWSDEQVATGLVEVAKKVGGAGALAQVDGQLSAKRHDLFEIIKKICQTRWQSEPDPEKVRAILDEAAAVGDGEVIEKIATCKDVALLERTIKAARGILESDELGI